MRLDLDAKVTTQDGHDVGQLQWVIVDPSTGDVSHLVVATEDLVTRTVEVPLSAIAETSADGDHVRLRFTKAEFDAQDEHLPAQYAGPPPGWHPMDAFSIPRDAYRWPASDPSIPTAAPRNTPEIGIAKGTAVYDRDGDDVGVVDDVQIDSHTGHLRGFILRVGGTFSTLFGGGQTVTVSADHVAQVDESAVYLTIAKSTLAGHAET